jgi:hypothetical protein
MAPVWPAPVSLTSPSSWVLPSDFHVASVIALSISILLNCVVLKRINRMALSKSGNTRSDGLN